MSEELNQIDPQEAAPEVEAKKRGRKPADKEPKPSRFQPYTTAEELPKPIVKKKVGKDGKHYEVVQKLGEPRFKVIGNKLVAIYRKPNGICQRLFKTLKKRDKDFRANLKKAGIPGA